MTDEMPASEEVNAPQTSQTPSDTQQVPPPSVLELRIHGVNNTPPSGMLDLPEDDIEKVAGDDLGSFWRPKAESKAKLTPLDRGYVPPTVTREAYSWGGMARNSIGGVSGWQKFVAVAARLGWTLLLPFGLINVAYWSRRLDATPDGKEAKKKLIGGGAGTLRLIGVLMTLLVTVAAAVLSMDDVAIQCYADKQRECKNLPSQIGFLRNWTVTERLALLSLIPLLLLILLWALSAKTRATYDAATWAAPTGHAIADEKTAFGAAMTQKSWPMLRTKGFWHHHVISSKTAFLHLAAGTTLIAGLTSWQGVFGATECRLPADLFKRSQCRTELTAAGGRGVAELIVVVVCAVMLVSIAWLTVKGSADAADIDQEGATPKRLGVYVVIVATFVVFFTQEAFLIWWRTDTITASHLVGLSNATTVIVCLLFGLSLSALFWRRYLQRFLLPLGLLAGALLLASGVSGAWGWVWRSSALLLVVVILIIFRRGGATVKFQAWRGCAPGVALLLALLIAMTLLTAFVVGVADILNGANSNAALAGRPPAPPQPKCPFSCDVVHAPANLLLPQPFVWFGVGLLIFLALLLITVICVAVWVAREPSGRRKAIVAPDPLLPETPADLVRTTPARKFAQIAHRGEPLLGLIALLGSVGVLSSILVAVSWTGPDHPTGWQSVADGALGPGMWASAGVGALVIAFAAGGSLVGGKRPFGLLWDLICFLPRAGHPLGPPCYAERAVPELLTRCHRYLTPLLDSDVHGKKVILSAHSLGSVIAVAAIFGSHGDEQFAEQVPQLSLLTYGTQLRAYFGRIFPELLGPAVLGNHRVEPAGLIDPNPVVASGKLAPGSPARNALASLLHVNVTKAGGRWRSLWRRTDYLGFPAYDGISSAGENVQTAGDTTPPNDVDRAAQEIDQTGYMLSVLSHSNYPRTDAYREQLTYLIENVAGDGESVGDPGPGVADGS